MSVYLGLEQHQTATCPRCKTQHTLPAELYHTAMAKRNDDKTQTIYCPYGHPWHYTPQRELDEQEKIRQERDRLRQRLAEKDDYIREERERREHAERSASAYKGKVTRLKNRAQAGLCPCCNRSFQNLHRHMQTQHPDFQKEEA